MNTPLRRLADNLLEGGVDSFVISRRTKRKSWRTIALDLRDATHGEIDVTSETLRSWYRDADARTAA